MVSPKNDSEEFEFYLKIARPFVLNLTEANERVKAAAWIKKLNNHEEGKLRTDYLKLLLFVMQRRRLTGLFSEMPNLVTPLDPLENFPGNCNLQEMVRRVTDMEKVVLRETIEKGGFGEWPPYMSSCDVHLKQYAAMQQIPEFGIQAFFAVSRDPLTAWNKFENAIIPRAIQLVHRTKFSLSLDDLDDHDFSCYIEPSTPPEITELMAGEKAKVEEEQTRAVSPIADFAAGEPAFDVVPSPTESSVVSPLPSPAVSPQASPLPPSVVPILSPPRRRPSVRFPSPKSIAEVTMISPPPNWSSNLIRLNDQMKKKFDDEIPEGMSAFKFQMMERKELRAKKRLQRDQSKKRMQMTLPQDESDEDEEGPPPSPPKSPRKPPRPTEEDFHTMVEDIEFMESNLPVTTPSRALSPRRATEKENSEYETEEEPPSELEKSIFDEPLPDFSGIAFEDELHPLFYQPTEVKKTIEAMAMSHGQALEEEVIDISDDIEPDEFDDEDVSKTDVFEKPLPDFSDIPVEEDDSEVFNQMSSKVVMELSLVEQDPPDFEEMDDLFESASEENYDTIFDEEGVPDFSDIPVREPTGEEIRLQVLEKLEAKYLQKPDELPSRPASPRRSPPRRPKTPSPVTRGSPINEASPRRSPVPHRSPAWYQDMIFQEQIPDFSTIPYSEEDEPPVEEEEFDLHGELISKDVLYQDDEFEDPSYYKYTSSSITVEKLAESQYEDVTPPDFDDVDIDDEQDFVPDFDNFNIPEDVLQQSPVKVQPKGPPTIQSKSPPRSSPAKESTPPRKHFSPPGQPQSPVQEVELFPKDAESTVQIIAARTGKTVKKGGKLMSKQETSQVKALKGSSVKEHEKTEREKKGTDKVEEKASPMDELERMKMQARTQIQSESVSTARHRPSMDHKLLEIQEMEENLKRSSEAREAMFRDRRPISSIRTSPARRPQEDLEPEISDHATKVEMVTARTAKSLKKGGKLLSKEETSKVKFQKGPAKAQTSKSAMTSESDTSIEDPKKVDKTLAKESDKSTASGSDMSVKDLKKPVKSRLPKPPAKKSAKKAAKDDDEGMSPVSAQLAKMKKAEKSGDSAEKSEEDSMQQAWKRAIEARKAEQKEKEKVAAAKKGALSGSKQKVTTKETKIVQKGGKVVRREEIETVNESDEGVTDEATPTGSQIFVEESTASLVKALPKKIAPTISPISKQMAKMKQVTELGDSKDMERSQRALAVEEKYRREQQAKEAKKKEKQIQKKTSAAEPKPSKSSRNVTTKQVKITKKGGKIVQREEVETVEDVQPSSSVGSVVPMTGRSDEFAGLSPTSKDKVTTTKMKIMKKDGKVVRKEEVTTVDEEAEENVAVDKEIDIEEPKPSTSKQRVTTKKTQLTKKNGKVVRKNEVTTVKEKDVAKSETSTSKGKLPTTSSNVEKGSGKGQRGKEHVTTVVEEEESEEQIAAKKRVMEVEMSYRKQEADKKAAVEATKIKKKTGEEPERYTYEGKKVELIKKDGKLVKKEVIKTVKETEEQKQKRIERVLSIDEAYRKEVAEKEARLKAKKAQRFGGPRQISKKKPTEKQAEKSVTAMLPEEERRSPMSARLERMKKQALSLIQAKDPAVAEEILKKMMKSREEAQEEAKALRSSEASRRHSPPRAIRVPSPESSPEEPSVRPYHVTPTEPWKTPPHLRRESLQARETDKVPWWLPPEAGKLVTSKKGKQIFRKAKEPLEKESSVPLSPEGGRFRSVVSLTRNLMERKRPLKLKKIHKSSDPRYASYILPGGKRKRSYRSSSRLSDEQRELMELEEKRKSFKPPSLIHVEEDAEQEDNDWSEQRWQYRRWVKGPGVISPLPIQGPQPEQRAREPSPRRRSPSPKKSSFEAFQPLAQSSELTLDLPEEPERTPERAEPSIPPDNWTWQTPPHLKVNLSGIKRTDDSSVTIIIEKTSKYGEFDEIYEDEVLDDDDLLQEIPDDFDELEVEESFYEMVEPVEMQAILSQTSGFGVFEEEAPDIESQYISPPSPHEPAGHPLGRDLKAARRRLSFNDSPPPPKKPSPLSKKLTKMKQTVEEAGGTKEQLEARRRAFDVEQTYRRREAAKEVAKQEKKAQRLSAKAAGKPTPSTSKAKVTAKKTQLTKKDGKVSKKEEVAIVEEEVESEERLAVKKRVMEINDAWKKEQNEKQATADQKTAKKKAAMVARAKSSSSKITTTKSKVTEKDGKVVKKEEVKTVEEQEDEMHAKEAEKQRVLALDKTWRQAEKAIKAQGKVKPEDKDALVKPRVAAKKVLAELSETQKREQQARMTEREVRKADEARRSEEKKQTQEAAKAQRKARDRAMEPQPSTSQVETREVTVIEKDGRVVEQTELEMMVNTTEAAESDSMTNMAKGKQIPGKHLKKTSKKSTDSQGSFKRAKQRTPPRERVRQKRPMEMERIGDPGIIDIYDPVKVRQKNLGIEPYEPDPFDFEDDVFVPYKPEPPVEWKTPPHLKKGAPWPPVHELEPELEKFTVVTSKKGKKIIKKKREPYQPSKSHLELSPDEFKDRARISISSRLIDRDRPMGSMKMSKAADPRYATHFVPGGKPKRPSSGSFKTLEENEIRKLDNQRRKFQPPTDAFEEEKEGEDEGWSEQIWKYKRWKKGPEVISPLQTQGQLTTPEHRYEGSPESEEGDESPETEPSLETYSALFGEEIFDKGSIDFSGIEPGEEDVEEIEEEEIEEVYSELIPMQDIITGDIGDGVGYSIFDAGGSQWSVSSAEEQVDLMSEDMEEFEDIEFDEEQDFVPDMSSIQLSGDALQGADEVIEEFEEVTTVQSTDDPHTPKLLSPQSLAKAMSERKSLSKQISKTLEKHKGYITPRRSSKIQKRRLFFGERSTPGRDDSDNIYKDVDDNPAEEEQPITEGDRNELKMRETWQRDIALREAEQKKRKGSKGAIPRLKKTVYDKNGKQSTKKKPQIEELSPQSQQIARLREEALSLIKANTTNEAEAILQDMLAGRVPYRDEARALSPPRRRDKRSSPLQIQVPSPPESPERDEDSFRPYHLAPTNQWKTPPKYKKGTIVVPEPQDQLPWWLPPEAGKVITSQKGKKIFRKAREPFELQPSHVPLSPDAEEMREKVSSEKTLMERRRPLKQRPIQKVSDPRYSTHFIPGGKKKKTPSGRLSKTQKELMQLENKRKKFQPSSVIHVEDDAEQEDEGWSEQIWKYKRWKKGPEVISPLHSSETSISEDEEQSPRRSPSPVSDSSEELEDQIPQSSAITIDSELTITTPDRTVQQKDRIEASMPPENWTWKTPPDLKVDLSKIRRPQKTPEMTFRKKKTENMLKGTSLTEISSTVIEKSVFEGSPPQFGDMDVEYFEGELEEHEVLENISEDFDEYDEDMSFYEERPEYAKDIFHRTGPGLLEEEFLEPPSPHEPAGHRLGRDLKAPRRRLSFSDDEEETEPQERPVTAPTISRAKDKTPKRPVTAVETEKPAPRKPVVSPITKQMTKMRQTAQGTAQSEQDIESRRRALEIEERYRRKEVEKKANLAEKKGAGSSELPKPSTSKGKVTTKKSIVTKKGGKIVRKEESATVQEDESEEKIAARDREMEVEMTLRKQQEEMKAEAEVEQPKPSTSKGKVTTKKSTVTKKGGKIVRKKETTTVQEEPDSEERIAAKKRAIEVEMAWRKEEEEKRAAAEAEQPKPSTSKGKVTTKKTKITKKGGKVVKKEEKVTTVEEKPSEEDSEERRRVRQRTMDVEMAWRQEEQAKQDKKEAKMILKNIAKEDEAKPSTSTGKVTTTKTKITKKGGKVIKKEELKTEEEIEDKRQRALALDKAYRDAQAATQDESEEKDDPSVETRKKMLEFEQARKMKKEMIAAEKQRRNEEVTRRVQMKATKQAEIDAARQEEAEVEAAMLESERMIERKLGKTSEKVSKDSEPTASSETVTEELTITEKDGRVEKRMRKILRGEQRVAEFKRQLAQANIIAEEKRLSAMKERAKAAILSGSESEKTEESESDNITTTEIIIIEEDGQEVEREELETTVSTTMEKPKRRTPERIQAKGKQIPGKILKKTSKKVVTEVSEESIEQVPKISPSPAKKKTPGKEVRTKETKIVKKGGKVVEKKEIESTVSTSMMDMASELSNESVERTTPPKTKAATEKKRPPDSKKVTTKETKVVKKGGKVVKREETETTVSTSSVDVASQESEEPIDRRERSVSPSKKTLSGEKKAHEKKEVTTKETRVVKRGGKVVEKQEIETTISTPTVDISDDESEGLPTKKAVSMQKKGPAKKEVTTKETKIVKKAGKIVQKQEMEATRSTSTIDEQPSTSKGKQIPEKQMKKTSKKPERKLSPLSQISPKRRPSPQRIESGEFELKSSQRREKRRIYRPPILPGGDPGEIEIYDPEKIKAKNLEKQGFQERKKQTTTIVRNIPRKSEEYAPHHHEPSAVWKTPPHLKREYLESSDGVWPPPEPDEFVTSRKGKKMKKAKLDPYELADSHVPLSPDDIKERARIASSSRLIDTGRPMGQIALHKGANPRYATHFVPGGKRKGHTSGPKEPEERRKLKQLEQQRKKFQPSAEAFIEEDENEDEGWSEQIWKYKRWKSGPEVISPMQTENKFSDSSPEWSPASVPSYRSPVSPSSSPRGYTPPGSPKRTPEKYSRSEPPENWTWSTPPELKVSKPSPVSRRGSPTRKDRGDVSPDENMRKTITEKEEKVYKGGVLESVSSYVLEKMVLGEQQNFTDLEIEMFGEDGMDDMEIMEEIPDDFEKEEYDDESFYDEARDDDYSRRLQSMVSDDQDKEIYNEEEPEYEDIGDGPYYEVDVSPDFNLERDIEEESIELSEFEQTERQIESEKSPRRESPRMSPKEEPKVKKTITTKKTTIIEPQGIPAVSAKGKPYIKKTRQDFKLGPSDVELSPASKRERRSISRYPPMSQVKRPLSQKKIHKASDPRYATHFKRGGKPKTFHGGPSQTEEDQQLQELEERRMNFQPPTDVFEEEGEDEDSGWSEQIWKYKRWKKGPEVISPLTEYSPNSSSKSQEAEIDSTLATPSKYEKYTGEAPPENWDWTTPPDLRPTRQQPQRLKSPSPKTPPRSMHGSPPVTSAEREHAEKGRRGLARYYRKQAEESSYRTPSPELQRDLYMETPPREVYSPKEGGWSPQTRSGPPGPYRSTKKPSRAPRSAPARYHISRDYVHESNLFDVAEVESGDMLEDSPPFEVLPSPSPTGSPIFGGKKKYAHVDEVMQSPEFYHEDEQSPVSSRYTRRSGMVRTPTKLKPVALFGTTPPSPGAEIDEDLMRIEARRYHEPGLRTPVASHDYEEEDEDNIPIRTTPKRSIRPRPRNLNSIIDDIMEKHSESLQHKFDEVLTSMRRDVKDVASGGVQDISPPEWDDDADLNESD